MRAAIAKRMSEAMQTVPHFYLQRRLAVSKLLALRGTLNESLADKGEKLSLNDLFIRAVALALMEAPEVNVSFAGDAILQHHHADIGVAMALPDGLITPIVRACEEKSPRVIADEVRRLAVLASERRLKPTDYEGGSFSISNLGMYGIDAFTAIINPPQAAILAVGTIHEGHEVHEAQVTLTLSCDHRAIDGATGAQFLHALADYTAHPVLLLF